MRPAIGYIRVSTEDQAKEGLSLPAQRARIASYAQAMGLDLVQVFADEGISGKSLNKRPGARGAIDRACQDHGVLVTYSLSRLFRSTKDAILASERLEKGGADLASITENLDTSTPTGRMLFRMLAVFAEFERELIADRTKNTMAHCRVEGLKISRFPPFGSRFTEDGRLEPVEQEQAVLRVAVSQYQESGSLSDTVRFLNDSGRLGRGGKPWNPGTLWRILKRGG